MFWSIDGSDNVDDLCDLSRTSRIEHYSCSMSNSPLLSSGARANMTAGYKPCPWLIPEDVPRKRLQPPAGRFYFVELGGIEPLAGPGPDPVRQHRASPANAKGQRTDGFKILDLLAFFHYDHIINKLYEFVKRFSLTYNKKMIIILFVG